MATMMATTTSARMKVPNWAPDMGSSRLSLDLLEAARRLGEGLLGRQALHARRAVKAVTLRTLRQDEFGVLGRGDGAAVAQHDHVLVHLARRLGPGVDA